MERIVINGTQYPKMTFEGQNVVVVLNFTESGEAEELSFTKEGNDIQIYKACKGGKRKRKRLSKQQIAERKLFGKIN